jgi:GNAT superfamily N-acetyltransferase
MGTSRTVRATGPQFDAAYDALLRPSFPPDELYDRENLAAGLRDGWAQAFITYVDEEAAAVAVMHGGPGDDVELLSYIAVAERWRGTGVGGTLLDDVIDDAARSPSPVALLAEIEHPLKPAATTSWGDPRRRFAFYARRGARVLDLPYFQPRLHPGASRVRGMLLLALHVDDRLLTPDGRMRAAPLAAFLRGNLEHAEGAPPTDNEALALLERAGDPGGVCLLDMMDAEGYRFPDLE